MRGREDQAAQRRNAQQHCAEQIMIMKIARIAHGRSFDLSKNSRADFVVITALRPYSLRCAAVLRLHGFAAALFPRGFVCGCVSVATCTVLNARPYGTTDGVRTPIFMIALVDTINKDPNSSSTPSLANDFRFLGAPQGGL